MASKNTKQVAVRTIEYAVPADNDLIAIESEDLARRADKLVIKNDKGAASVGELLISVKAQAAAVAEKEEEILKPLKEALKPLTKHFKDIKDRLGKAEEVLKSALSQWRVRKIEETTAFRNITAELGAVVATNGIPKIENDMGRVSFSDKMVFIIEDVGVIPVDIIRNAVNTKRGREGLEQVIRALVEGGMVEIPGVLIRPSSSVSVTLAK